MFTDSTATMARVINDAPGLSQEIAIWIISLAQTIIDQGNTVTIGWTPAHRGVQGNEHAGHRANEAAAKKHDWALEPRLPQAQGHRAGYCQMEKGHREQES